MVTAMTTDPDSVFVLWCELTGNTADLYGDEEREAFLARPQLAALAMTPRAVLLDAGFEVARRGSLPLERWLHAVRIARPEDRMLATAS